MATLPLQASHKEQHSVIRFQWMKGLGTNAIHSEMRPVYGDSIVLLDRQYMLSSRNDWLPCCLSFDDCWYSGINFLQNVYLRFFIFWHLKECRLVTYLCDEPNSGGVASGDLAVLDDWQVYDCCCCIVVSVGLAIRLTRLHPRARKCYGARIL